MEHTATVIVTIPATPTGPARTFVIAVTSTRSGYETRISERLAPDDLVPMALEQPPKLEIDAGTFYRHRERYRAFLLECIVEELKKGSVRRPVAGDRKAVLHATIGANLRGWPDGHPAACDDDLAGWDPYAEAAETATAHGESQTSASEIAPTLRIGLDARNAAKLEQYRAVYGLPSRESAARRLIETGLFGIMGRLPPTGVEVADQGGDQ